MASILDSLKAQMQRARGEYKEKRKSIEQQIAQLERDLDKLDAEYAMLDSLNGKRRGGPPAGAKRGGRGKSGLGYGGVRSAVLDTIKATKGIKPAQIVDKTGLASAQVHNALTGLKKSKEVRVKDGLYTAA
jgi:hypothetical protein